MSDWLKATENGGDLWRLQRGDLYGHVITEVKIAEDGRHILFKTKNLWATMGDSLPTPAPLQAGRKAHE